MSTAPTTDHVTPPRAPSSIEVHLLGLVNYDRCLELQQALIDDAISRADRRAVVLLCEHPAAISVGRSGSWSQLNGSVQSAHPAGGRPRPGVPLHWSNRGGRCQLHLPGQINLYGIVPIEAIGWSVGEYLGRLERALTDVCGDVRVEARRQRPGRGLWARAGQVAAVGVAVKHGVSYYGAQLNVEPDLGAFARHLRVDAQQRYSSLAAETRRPMSMSRVRSFLLARLAEAFDCQRLGVSTGHPLLRSIPTAPTGEVASVV
ncbi:MAG: hypothetical protein R3C10_04740 [Pirellulales bacterium]